MAAVGIALAGALLGFGWAKLWEEPPETVRPEAWNPTVECVVCMNHPKEVVLIPCAHRCMCASCANRVDRCPICRQVIDQRLQVFDS